MTYFHPQSAVDGIWLFVCNVTPHILPAAFAEGKIWSCGASFLGESVVTRLYKQKEPLPVHVSRTKAVMWIISSTYLFFNQIEFIFVHFNLIWWKLQWHMYPKTIYSIKYSFLSLTRKNICNLIAWEGYNIGRICTLFSIFVPFDQIRKKISIWFS